MSDIEHSGLGLAQSQGGVLSCEQARGLGYSGEQVRYRLNIGRWSPEGRFGYRLLPARDHLDRIRSAVALLPNAVVSHESAAELLDVPRVLRGLAVVSVHTRTTHDYPGVVVRRCHDLLESHVEERGGLPVTTIARTVVDLAARLHPQHLRDVVDDLLLSRRLPLGSLESVVSDVARRGRPGSAALRNLMEELEADPARESKLERAGRRLIEEAGLPEPHHEFAMPWAPHRRFDDAWPENKVAVEWDSLGWHLRADAFQSDRKRDRDAQLQGWTVFRFTWEDVHRRPLEVILLLRKALSL